MKRIKQFLRCITARLTEEDKDFIKKYLNSREIELLKKLPIYDVKHCINVAKSIIDNEKKEDIDKIFINYNELIRSALLHDIGKGFKTLNPIEKSILVIGDKLTKGNIKKYEKINDKVYIYYNHGQEGYNLLKDKKYSEEFLNIIRDHHNYNKNNEWLNIIRKYDDMN